MSHEGKEYGTLRSFEEAIIQEAGATVSEIPVHRLSPLLKKHFGHGMTRAKYRNWFPPQAWNNEKADIAWYILMGPENYQLDQFKNWQGQYKKKILYIFDTLPSQYPLIKKLFSNSDWDMLITSFNDAVPDLEQLTGRKWYTLEQATDTSFFTPLQLHERTIPFSAFGRRNPIYHEAVKSFCADHHLYYDYTMAASWEKNLDGRDLYQQYAWHLNHSVFTFSWPVELTTPDRAGHLHPITCRWFEAAAAGTVMIGKAPENSLFEDLLFPGAVQRLAWPATVESIHQQLKTLWEARAAHHQVALRMQATRSQQWSWRERVQRVLSWL